ncbi:uncharacterized protein LOC127721356 isoform X2 [Mytilus californianus]|uniref:uncharacterized protein LOC127721356 isoform X2 n=1 Tax=Mytilus californianus TaxID=6549 RepID=UPI002247E73A|nr:uncharacterized protein LOC127721356 isoform X2 [Mytilus californianus]
MHLPKQILIAMDGRSEIFILNVDSFNLKCPSQANWKFRAKVKCNSTLKYFCLYNNVERKYVEGCDGPDWDRKGSKRIFAGYFTREQCIQERFQPIKFRTNESMSDCVYAKSICSEEGQLMQKENSTKDDRTCRCDHRKNYSFIHTPRNLCFCIPTKEDCSCFIRSCPANYTLSSDYKCIQSGYQEKPKCIDDKYYVTVDDTNRVLIERNETWLSVPTFKLKFKWRDTPDATILFIICVMHIIVAVGFFFAVLIHYLAKEHLLHCLSGPIQIKKGRISINGNRSSVDLQSLKVYIGIDQIDSEIDDITASENVSMDTIDGNDHVSCDRTSDDKGQSIYNI